MNRDFVPLADPAVIADSRTAGDAQKSDPPRRGKEIVFRVFGVDSTLDGVAAPLNVFLFERQTRSGGHRDLLTHQIKTSHQFSNRMFDLQASIHLEKIKLARRIGKKKFDCAGANVIHGSRDLDRGLAHALAQRRIINRRWAFFDDLLMATLNRTLTLAEVHNLAVAVGKHLNLDMAWARDDFLKIDFGVAKS